MGLLENNFSPRAQDSTKECNSTSSKAAASSRAGHVGHVTSQIVQETRGKLPQPCIQLRNLLWRRALLWAINKCCPFWTKEGIINIAKRDELGFAQGRVYLATVNSRY